MSSSSSTQPKDSGASESKGDAAAGASGGAGAAVSARKEEVSDETVVRYLRKKGLTAAALELTKMLKTDPPSARERLEMDESESRQQRTVLARTAGGGLGYDLDSAAQIPQWGVPDKKVDSAIGVDEARAYVDSFVELQTWVLALPDNGNTATIRTKHINPVLTGVSIASIAEKRAGEGGVPERIKGDIEYLGSLGTPSAKPELLSVTFALLVHTYCALLEVGMESTAKSILETFRSIYEPVYTTELRDLDHCTSTSDMVSLNAHNSSHLDALNRLKANMVQVANLQLKTDELTADTSNTNNPAYQQAKRQKLADYEKLIKVHKQKYEEIAKGATEAFGKMQGLPFLRRARAVKWQITLSTTTYSLLAGFLSSRESLLPMNTLLLKQCEIQVQKRDPLPQIPACILDDNSIPNRKRARIEGEISWAAPVARSARKAEAGEEGNQTQNIPFPKYYQNEEYESSRDAARDKQKVEYNRSVLMNGFRRLEALERKREYEVGLVTEDGTQTNTSVNPFEPSILMSTLCSSSSPGPQLAVGRSVDASSIWEEPGVCLTCARICPPDGRRVAAGCDDAAVRVWSAMDNPSDDVKETAMVLLGHKNGFPVFDVNWNRDGRTLLSAGGDGSIRLWDTMMKGTFGSVSKTSRKKPTPVAPTKIAEEEGSPGMPVPGLRPETTEEVNGAALAVYRGHTPNCPIWSVSFSPAGYYFASSGADGTGRIWVTDRPNPVRILSGHNAASVNTIVWHPNCNYVLTGCDDKTIRMWDVHNGRCVRLLNGCSSGINAIQVSPSGRYAAGSDYSGVVHLWELDSGKKVGELQGSSVVHALAYSSCGTALAVGGDDCAVRIWDVRGACSGLFESSAPKGGLAPSIPHKCFPTRRTVLLDLKYTKRNLLLGVGKYVTPVPLLID